jgi:hypothetical protein
MNKLFSQNRAVFSALMLATACFSALVSSSSPASATTCGVSDSCSTNSDWTKKCCTLQGLRCKIYVRRVCGTNPAQFQYALIANPLALCPHTNVVHISEPLNCVTPDGPEEPEDP